MLHRREATILASRNSTAAEHRRVLDSLENGQIDISDWPTEIAAPENIQQRFPVWLRRAAGVVKAVIEWA